MQTTILVRVDKNYGQKVIYPVCDRAKLLAELTGTKTFPEWAIDVIKKLDYEVEVVNNQAQYL